jgi:tetratricopeptide (TPR) repeat protein
MTWMMTLGLVLAMGLAGNPEFEHGRSLYNEFEYEEAVSLFRLLVKTPGRSAADKAQLHAWVGLCYAQMGRNAQAQDAFDRAVGYDPAVLPPPDSPPKVIQMMESSRQEVATPESQAKRKKRAVKRWKKAREPAADPHDDPAGGGGSQGEDSGAELADIANYPGGQSQTSSSGVDEFISKEDGPAFPMLLVGAGIGGGLAVVAFAGSATFGSLALLDQGRKDDAVFQDEAQGHLDSALFNATVSNALAGTGALLMGASLGLWAYSLMEGET